MIAVSGSLDADCDSSDGQVGIDKLACIHMVDKQLQLRHSFRKVVTAGHMGSRAITGMAVCNEYLYVSEHVATLGPDDCGRLRCFSLVTFNLICNRSSHDSLATSDIMSYGALALAPGTVLFVVASENSSEGIHDVVVAVNPFTLLPTFRISDSLGEGADTAWRMLGGLAVVGSTLCVSVINDRSIRVFTLSGIRMRVITGEWKQPGWICRSGFESRFYLGSETNEDELFPECSEDPERYNEMCFTHIFPAVEASKRVFVVDLGGESSVTSYSDPADGMCYFGGGLLSFVRGEVDEAPGNLRELDILPDVARALR